MRQREWMHVGMGLMDAAVYPSGPGQPSARHGASVVVAPYALPLARPSCPILHFLPSFLPFWTFWTQLTTYLPSCARGHSQAASRATGCGRLRLSTRTTSPCSTCAWPTAWNGRRTSLTPVRSSDPPSLADTGSHAARCHVADSNCLWSHSPSLLPVLAPRPFPRPVPRPTSPSRSWSHSLALLPVPFPVPAPRPASRRHGRPHQLPQRYRVPEPPRPEPLVPQRQVASCCTCALAQHATALTRSTLGLPLDSFEWYCEKQEYDLPEETSVLRTLDRPAGLVVRADEPPSMR